VRSFPEASLFLRPLRFATCMYSPCKLFEMTPAAWSVFRVLSQRCKLRIREGRVQSKYTHTIIKQRVLWSDHWFLRSLRRGGRGGGGGGGGQGYCWSLPEYTQYTHASLVPWNSKIAFAYIRHNDCPRLVRCSCSDDTPLVKIVQQDSGFATGLSTRHRVVWLVCAFPKALNSVIVTLVSVVTEYCLSNYSYYY
jgi:hypothetical protein